MSNLILSHVAVIQSSHEMGCMLTVRLMSVSAQWVWVNMVLHIRQPFSGDNGDPAIVCTNHVVSEQDSTGYKLQSQLYSSHIARSPEIFPSPSGGSPHHTITQESGQEQYQPQPEGSGAFSGMSQSQIGQPQPRTSTSSLSDSGSELSPVQEQKNVRADIINRLKRKMSESGPPCKPVKMAKQHEQQRGASEQSGGSVSYTGSIGVAPLGTSAASFLETGAFSVGGGTLADPPVYVQLPTQPHISINPKDLLTDLQQLSPLTPSSITSEVSNTSEFGSSLCVDVNDVAVVPASFLTPDSSPATSPKLQNSTQLLSDIVSLEDISFFAEKSLKEKVEVVEVKEEKCSTTLPELDVPILEKYFMGNDLSLNPDEMMMIMEQSIKKEEVEEDLMSMCESLLDLPAPTPGSDCLSSVESPLASETEEIEQSPLPANHEQLIEELTQLSAAANGSPSYGRYSHAFMQLFMQLFSCYCIIKFHSSFLFIKITLLKVCLLSPWSVTLCMFLMLSLSCVLQVTIWRAACSTQHCKSVRFTPVIFSMAYCHYYVMGTFISK